MPSSGPAVAPGQSLSPLTTPSPLPGSDLTGRQDNYLTSAYSPNTLRAYRAAWKHFCNWCQQADPLPVPATRLLMYLEQAANDGVSYSTLSMRCAAIDMAHNLRKLPSPRRDERVRLFFRGVRRQRGALPKPLPPSFSFDALRQLRDSLAGADDHKTLRDRALLFCGIFGAFRAGELLDMRRAQLTRLDNGDYLCRLGATKTDPGNTRHKYKLLPIGTDDDKLRPAAMLHQWLALLPDDPQQPVFCGLRGTTPASKPLSQWGATKILRSRTRAAGLGAHYDLTAMRRSYVTLCRDQGIDDSHIIYQTHHQSPRALQYYDAPDRQGRLLGATRLLACYHEDAT